MTWGEQQVPLCEQRKQLQPPCLHLGCDQGMVPRLWEHLRDRSIAIHCFAEETSAEVTRLKALAGGALRWAAAPTQPGPVCGSCGLRHLALLRNADCSHEACEVCWTQWAESHLDTCRSELRLAMCCQEPGCGKQMADGIWRHVCTRSAPLRDFAQHIDAHVERLRRTAGGMFHAPAPCEAGPQCGICREPHLALLRNPGCAHTACEGCWAGWATSHVDRCRDEKRAALRCLGERCQEAAAAEAWLHSCTLSEAVGALEEELTKRRRLQGNELYPPAAQVDCPREGCLGLGYLGFDTVMCFFCEHQWQVDEGTAPPGIGEELLAGEVAKRCPACGEHIIKNGGCDHMTCRCGHEFWWTTLQPYRR